MATGDDGRGELLIAGSDLPGLAAVDEELVESAVARVNRIYVVKGLETYLEIGRCVLDTFFGGDPANFRDRARDHVSFREMANRSELIPSHSHIYNAVAVVAQFPSLPADVREHLSASHHKALLPVKDVEAKGRLARRAVEETLSVAVLRAEVQSLPTEKKVKSRTGRPPLPGFVKGINKLVKAADALDAIALGETDLDRYSPADARRLLEELEARAEALVTCRRRLSGQIDTWEERRG